MKVFKLSAITSLFNTGFYLATSLIVLYFSDIGMSEFLIGLAMTLTRLSYGLASIFSGAMADRVGRYYPMMMGFLLGALSMIFLSLLRSQYLAITMAILGLGRLLYLQSSSPSFSIGGLSRDCDVLRLVLLLPDGWTDSRPSSLRQYDKDRRLRSCFHTRRGLELDLSSTDLALVQG